MTDDNPAIDTTESSPEEQVPKIYEWSAPRARWLKAIIQMAIGTVAAVIVVGMAIRLAWPPCHAHTGKNIQTHVFTTIGVALAVAAGVELAYTLFTHGPDEALDPLMLGLSAALILQLAKVDGFDLKQAASAVIYVIALGITFTIRKFLAKDPKFKDWAPSWRCRGRIPSGVGIGYYQQALAIFRETGDQHGEGLALTNLGNAYQGLRRFDEAIGRYQQALAIFRETGHRRGEGLALTNLGLAYQEVGQRDRAARCWREAAAAMHNAGDHEEAGRLEQLAASAQARRHHWWRRGSRPAGI